MGGGSNDEVDAIPYYPRFTIAIERLFGRSLIKQRMYNDFPITRDSIRLGIILLLPATARCKHLWSVDGQRAHCAHSVSSGLTYRPPVSAILLASLIGIPRNCVKYSKFFVYNNS